MRPVETRGTVGRVKNFDGAVAENLLEGEIAFFPAIEEARAERGCWGLLTEGTLRAFGTRLTIVYGSTGLFAGSVGMLL